MALTPGTRLGPYTIETLIGSGGMGEVYKAHDERLNRTVAIKRMIADDVSRFQSEARAIAAINHPHICQISASPRATRFAGISSSLSGRLDRMVFAATTSAIPR